MLKVRQLSEKSLPRYLKDSTGNPEYHYDYSIMPEKCPTCWAKVSGRKCTACGHVFELFRVGKHSKPQVVNRDVMGIPHEARRTYVGPPDYYSLTNFPGYTMSQFAKLFNVSKLTVLAWAHEHLIKRFYFKGTLLVTRASAEKIQQLRDRHKAWIKGAKRAAFLKGERV